MNKRIKCGRRKKEMEFHHNHVMVAIFASQYKNGTNILNIQGVPGQKYIRRKQIKTFEFLYFFKQ